MLNLKLDVDKAFLNDVLVDRKAELKMAVKVTGSSAGTYPQEAVTAKGTFNVFNAGSSKNCAITAECTFDGGRLANKGATTDGDQMATLTATVVRRVHFAKGIAEVITDIPWDNIDATAETPAPADHVNFAGKSSATKNVATSTLKIARTDSSTDAVIEVVVDNVTVATGIIEDPNIGGDGKFWYKDVGKVHIDAVCEWARIAGLKPNPTHFNVRALDPHTVAITLENTVPEYSA